MFRQLIRLPLRCVPKSMVLPVMTGPSQGLKWVTGSGTHGYWLGTYERDRQERMLEVLKPGEFFLDIGANVGFYSLLASRIVGEQGQVHAFEPFPRNVSYLKQHVELNRLQNVTIYPVALSDGPDRTMNFATSINPSSGHLQGDHSDDHSIAVGVTSLDRLWSYKEFPCPSVIKIDVEGAEFSVLQGGKGNVERMPARDPFGWPWYGDSESMLRVASELEIPGASRSRWQNRRNVRVNGLA